MLHRHFSLFLAVRYLRPKRTLLSIITLISILGVTLGVMVLILVMSVMHGFEKELEDKVVGFDAHVVVSSSDRSAVVNWQDVATQIAKQKDVVAVSPFVQGPVLVESDIIGPDGKPAGHQRMAPKIRAVDPDLEKNVIDIKQYLVEGKYDLDGDKVILGGDLAGMLGVSVGDTIHLYSPGNLDEMMGELNRLEKSGDKTDASALKQMILPKDLLVTGIFESGRYLYDSDYMITPLYVGQEVYNLGDSVHGLAIRTTDRYFADDVKKELNAILPAPLYAETWIDLNKQIFDAIKMERNVMFFLLLFIILVAAFGIMNTLITMTVQKTREIGVMKALGAQTHQIIGVFFAQGIVVGLFGTLIGLLSGITLVHFRNQASDFLASTLHIEIFPRSVYQFSEIPAQVVPSDIVIICISAFIICSLASLIPAWFAARLDPVKALRYE